MRIEDPKLMAAFAALEVAHVAWQSLAELTSLGVGGHTALLRIRKDESLPELIRLLGDNHLPWKFLGGGTNLLVAGGELPWVVLQLAHSGPDLRWNGETVEVAAAADLGRTVMECAKRDRGGMEGLIGVPGTVGGALRMNAGAYGTEIGQFVRFVKMYRAGSGQIETLAGQDLRFEYRHTAFAADDIMLSAKLALPSKPYAQILEGIKICNEKRRASQPLNEKSAGCVFKNPPGGSAGRMIDELGLKGHRVGGAVVSERHANFFVNRYQATADDLFRLLEEVRERVRRAFGVVLEEEVIIWKS